MIQSHTYLDVADNSGARSVQCIKVLGGTNRRTATIGDIIVVAVKSAIPTGKVKKGDIHKGVIVRTKKQFTRSDGSVLTFDKNVIILIDKDGGPIGTRIFGPVSKELRTLGFLKIISLAPSVI